jgi:hypothetical protein
VLCYKIKKTKERDNKNNDCNQTWLQKKGGVLFKGATCMYTKAKKIFHFLRCVLNEGATFSAEITVDESKASDNLELKLVKSCIQ